MDMSGAVIRAAWVDHGQDAPYHALEKHLITDVYFDIRDPRLDLTYLNTVRGHGYAPGLYACSQGDGWPNPTTMSGPGFADWVYDKVQKQIAPGTSGSYPKVLLNCEQHDIGGWIIPMLKRWRSKSPRRETYWSMEGRQGGNMSPFVEQINKFNIGLAPQMYRGDMSPQPAGVVYELVRYGFAPGRIWAMYDGAALPWNWEWIGGFAFTAGRLP